MVPGLEGPSRQWLLPAYRASEGYHMIHGSTTGSKSKREYGRREYLVKRGKACFWFPYRSIEQAAQRAGL